MIEPPTWVPIAAGTMLAPTAAAEPEDEPPGVRFGSNGLVVGPGSEPPSSPVTVLARSLAPPWRPPPARAWRRWGECRWTAAPPRWLGMSFGARGSFTAAGRRGVGGRASPRSQRAARWPVPAPALAPFLAVTAFTTGSRW